MGDFTVPFTKGTYGPVSLSVDGGSDGVGGLVITTFTNDTGYVGALESGGTQVTYYIDADLDGIRDAGETSPAFRLTLDAPTGSYSFEVLVAAPFIRESLNFETIRAGGPQETISPPAGTGGATVTFDGLLFTGVAVPDEGDPESGFDAFNPGLTTDRDDANPDSLGFGIKDGQASQFNHDEGTKATYNDPATVGADEFAGLTFDIQAVGNTRSVTIEYWIVDDGLVVLHDSATVNNLPSGNNLVGFDVLDPTFAGSPLATLADSTFDAIYFRTLYDGNVSNKGVRLLNFEVITPGENEDLQFDFTARVDDGDSVPDSATTSFSVGVDGNGGGVIFT
ncbi:hypothetical protein [Falsiroseomonas sp.]|uniref:hypothetical protein n=1 Tax=Falsiroseomonas sp. TaxID=2870721 RepID=UPI00356A0C21